MATVGDQLLNPESGWQRIDDANKNIKYNGNWISATGDPNTYAGTAHYFTLGGTTENSIEFYFYGTKLRIIDMYWSNRVNNVTVELDGVISSYNPNNSTNKYRVIVFERLNLQYGFHKVKLTTTSTSNNFSLDAIDIDSNGEITAPPLNEFLISSEDKLIGFEDTGYVNMIPKMTRNTSASPVVPIYSGEFINGPGAGQGYAYQAFDDNTGTSACPITAPMYLGVDFYTPLAIHKYSITSSSFFANFPSTAWVFEASNDSTVWEILDTRTSITWSSSTTKEYEISNQKEYRYYRVRATINGTYFYNEIKMMMHQPPVMKILNDGADFVKHGMNKDRMLDMTVKMSKTKIVKTKSENLGSGKVFKQKIDRSKHKAHKIILG